MHILILLLLVVFVVRLITRPFRYARRASRFMGYGPGYNNGYGYGRRHRHGFGGGLFSILALVALDRLFRRW